MFDVAALNGPSIAILPNSYRPPSGQGPLGEPTYLPLLNRATECKPQRLIAFSHRPCERLFGQKPVQSCEFLFVGIAPDPPDRGSIVNKDFYFSLAQCRDPLVGARLRR